MSCIGIFLNYCGFNRPSDLWLVECGVGSYCALMKKAMPGCAVYVWAFRSVSLLIQLSLPCIKKAWEIFYSTGSREIGQANVCS